MTSTEYATYSTGWMENDETSPICKTPYWIKSSRENGARISGSIPQPNFYGTTSQPGMPRFRGYTTKSVNCQSSRKCPIDECRSKKTSESNSRDRNEKCEVKIGNNCEAKRNDINCSGGVVRWLPKCCPAPPSQPALLSASLPMAKCCRFPINPQVNRSHCSNQPQPQPQPQFQPLVFKCECCELRYCCWPTPMPTCQGGCTSLAPELSSQLCPSSSACPVQSSHLSEPHIYSTQSLRNKTLYGFPDRPRISAIQHTNYIDAPFETMREKIVQINGQLKPNKKFVIWPQHHVGHTEKYFQNLPGSQIMRLNYYT